MLACVLREGSTAAKKDGKESARAAKLVWAWVCSTSNTWFLARKSRYIQLVELHAELSNYS